MDVRKKQISLVIPVYNEEKVIPELIKQISNFINRLKKYNFEIITVEHGSSDKSFELLMGNARKDKRFKVLQLSRNFGCDGGVAAGMQFATGDACVIMMADLQEPVELIAKFIEKWEQGYDIVYGLVQRRTASFSRNLSSHIFYRMMRLISRNTFPENASDFRLVDRKVYVTINRMEERNKYLRGLFLWTGFRHTGVVFNRRKRFAGKSKADFKTVLGVALNGIFSFSYLPLRLVTYLGLGLMAFSFLMIGIYLYMFVTHQKVVPGFTTVIILILFLFGILFFVLGIVSEYLARIYDEVKRRPNYIIKNKINL